jgi:hypothetical protein
MANFDSNRWYQLLVKSASNVQSMDGSVLYDNGEGAVFFQLTNTSDPEQQWQLYPYNSSFYVLRTQASGPDSAMTVFASDTETTPGGTVPSMCNSTLSDGSTYWQISPWGDGTFFLTNAANGTAWHLLVKSNSLMAMSSNITLPQDGQSFSFNALGTIDDDRFSSINVHRILPCLLRSTY